MSASGTTNSDIFEPGFYDLNGRVINLAYDNGPKYGMFGRDFFNQPVKPTRQEMRSATRLENYSLTPAEIWEMTGKGRDINQHNQDKEYLERKEPDALERLLLYFEKMFEFGHLTLNTRGYHCQGKYVEGLKDSLGHQLSTLLDRFLEHRDFDRAETWSAEQKAAWDLQRAALLAWLVQPTKDTWSIFFQALPSVFQDKGCFIVTCSAQCPITNKRFDWGFDGVVLWPHALPVYDEKEMTPEELEWSRAPGPDGQRPRFGRIVRRPVEDFPYADGHLPRHVLDLDCPSGNLLFANILYDVFGEGDIHQFEINTEAGRNEQARHLHSKGAWHVYNSGRSHVYQSGDTILIGHWHDEIEGPQRPGKYISNPEPQGYEDRGNISGSLRWFYGCDEGTLPQDWQSKLKHPDMDLVRVKVTPGRYRLVNEYEHSAAEQGVCCRITRIGDVGEVRE